MQNKIILIVLLVSANLFFGQNSKFYTDSLYSKHLKEYRKHNIYLPANFKEGKKYPIIYATDGAAIIADKDPFKKILDSLIGNKIILPVIYIESYSNTKIVDTLTLGDGKKAYWSYRNYEYVQGNYTEGESKPALAKRYENHMLYFRDELIPTIEKTLKVKGKKNARIFYGYSNGAGFGANFLNKNPNVIGTFICFSTLGSNVDNLSWNNALKYPQLYIQYGNKEADIFKVEAESIINNYKNANSRFELNVFDGGHDYRKWNAEFAKTIVEILKT